MEMLQCKPAERGGSEKSQTNLVNSHAERSKPRLLDPGNTSTSNTDQKEPVFFSTKHGEPLLSLHLLVGYAVLPSVPGDLWQHYSDHLLAAGEIPTAMYHQEYKHRLSLDLSCRYSYCLYWSCLAASCYEDMPLSPCLRAKTTASEQRRALLCSLGAVLSLLVVSRDVSFCVAWELFSLCWLSAHCLFALQHPKGPSKCSVLLQREVQVANMKPMICKALIKQHQFPQLLMEPEINPLKANKEKTVEIKTRSTLGKHTRKFHFDDTKHHETKVPKRCFYTFQLNNPPDTNLASFGLAAAWNCWGYFIIIRIRNNFSIVF